MTAPVVLRPGTLIRCGRSWATVGALVQYRGQPHVLTVAHLICGRSPRRIDLPGVPPHSPVRACVPLRKFSTHTGDAALIAIEPGVPLDPDHPLVGPLQTHFQQVPLGLAVLLQAPSGLIEGHVCEVSWNGRVRYPWGSRRLANQILIRSDSAAHPRCGDSGALWVTREGVAVAVQVAATGRCAVATPLSPLLAEWDARLLRA